MDVHCIKNVQTHEFLWNFLHVPTSLDTLFCCCFYFEKNIDSNGNNSISYHETLYWSLGQLPTSPKKLSIILRDFILGIFCSFVKKSEF